MNAEGNERHCFAHFAGKHGHQQLIELKGKLIVSAGLVSTSIVHCNSSTLAICIIHCFVLLLKV